jgi:DtxR family transcriptional regulator, Mn-dependent transcriptional regulator
MTTVRPTPTIEDYLGVLYILHRDGEIAIGARLADLLEVSPPTVTMTIKRMARDGWVVLNDKKEITLTDEGVIAARSVSRRHILSELLLLRVLNVPWSKVHEEAHRLEHTFSKETEERLLAEFGKQQVCPHGNPLPSHEGILKEYLPLSEIPAGTRVVVKRVHEHAEDNLELLEYLETNGVLPGTEAVVYTVLPFNQTITLAVEERKVTFGFETAEFIYVEQVAPQTK